MIDLSFLDPVGRALIHAIELFVKLSTLTSGLSLVAAVISVWTMQVTTRAAGLANGEARMALVQRIAMALIAVFLVLNAVTPFITPDPPWLANLPLVVAIGLFMLAFGIAHARGERHRENSQANNDKGVVRAERDRVRKVAKQKGKTDGSRTKADNRAKKRRTKAGGA